MGSSIDVRRNVQPAPVDGSRIVRRVPDRRLGTLPRRIRNVGPR